MWPCLDPNFNRPVLLITPAVQPVCTLPRFQNASTYSPQNTTAIGQNFKKTFGEQSASRISVSRKCVQPTNDRKVSPPPSPITEDFLETLKKFEVSISEKVTDLVERNRKMERRVITTIGLNIDAANTKYIENKQMFIDFKTELEKEFEHFESEQQKLLSTLRIGIAEIKCALAFGKTNSSNNDANAGSNVDPTIMQLAPKFDESFKNHPVGFLRHFDTFIRSTKITPALQRLLFIYAVQLDNPIWRQNVANIETYEELKNPFLKLTWSKKQQARVYLEFKKASFKDLSPEQINAEVKKWCDIVRNMTNVDFRNFRLLLIEKLPRSWQTTLRVFAIGDFESLLRNIDFCLDNESFIPTFEYATSRNRNASNFNRSESEK